MKSCFGQQVKPICTRCNIVQQRKPISTLIHVGLTCSTRAALYPLTLLLYGSFDAAAGKATAFLLKLFSSSCKLTCLTHTTDVLAATHTYAGRNLVQRAAPQLQSISSDKMLCTEDKAGVAGEVCVRRAPRFHDCHDHSLILQQ